MTIEQDERYVVSQERIAAGIEAYVALRSIPNEEPLLYTPPISQKMGEIEQLVSITLRLKDLKISNPELISLIDQALLKEELSLTDLDVLVPLAK